MKLVQWLSFYFLLSSYSAIWDIRRARGSSTWQVQAPQEPTTWLCKGRTCSHSKEFSKATKNFSKSEILGSGRFRCGLQSALVPGLARFVIEIWCSCKDGATQKGLNRCLFTTIYQTKALTNGSSMKVKNNNLKCDVMWCWKLISMHTSIQHS